MTLEFYAGGSEKIGSLMEEALIAHAAYDHPEGPEAGVNALAGFRASVEDGRVFFENHRGQGATFSDVLKAPQEGILVVSGKAYGFEISPNASSVQESFDGLFARSVPSVGGMRPGIKMKSETPFGQ
jgi:hypothetical protein